MGIKILCWCLACPCLWSVKTAMIKRGYWHILLASGLPLPLVTDAVNTQRAEYLISFYKSFKCLLFFSFMACQDYFIHFELSQSVGGAKMGDPWEKTPDHPQAELSLSRIWSQLGSNPQRWDGQQFSVLKLSSLNHSATEAAKFLILFSWRQYRGIFPRFLMKI